MFISVWHLSSCIAAVLLRHLPNFRVIGMRVLWLRCWDATSGNKNRAIAWKETVSINLWPAGSLQWDHPIYCYPLRPIDSIIAANDCHIRLKIERWQNRQFWVGNDIIYDPSVDHKGCDFCEHGNKIMQRLSAAVWMPSKATGNST